MFMRFRRYLSTAREAAGVAKRVTAVWTFTRKMQWETLDIYNRLVSIAQKRGVNIPRTRVKMYAE